MNEGIVGFRTVIPAKMMTSASFSLEYLHRRPFNWWNKSIGDVSVSKLLVVFKIQFCAYDDIPYSCFKYISLLYFNDSLFVCLLLSRCIN